ncbi:MAG: hypothetical protein MPW14_20555 [Candidatus Manganitrophus sp.]|nr:MAG: hypothetical protein MPW17_09120 [Candidatus Manganitrophus sp.]WDT79501.1 MAG: hypothetical protein MPW14_20555 [Candidatus Manganitrophus sp.]
MKDAAGLHPDVERRLRVPPDLLDRREEVDDDLCAAHPQMPRRRDAVPAVVPASRQDDHPLAGGRAERLLDLVDQSPGRILHQQEGGNGVVGRRLPVELFHLLCGHDLHKT